MVEVLPDGGLLAVADGEPALGGVLEHVDGACVRGRDPAHLDVAAWPADGRVSADNVEAVDALWG